MAKKKAEKQYPHKRTDLLFERLKKQLPHPDQKINLAALSWLGTLIEEVGISVESRDAELYEKLDALTEKISDLTSEISELVAVLKKKI